MDDQPEPRTRYPRGALLWIPAVVFVVLGAVALWKVPELLLNHWVVSKDAEEQRKLLGTSAQIVLFALGGVIAVVGVALSIARHGESLKTAEQERIRQAFEVKKEDDRRAEYEQQQKLEVAREERRIVESNEQRYADKERELRARFVSTVDLLSAAAPIKRTSGLYAIAALADDWLVVDRGDEAQVCIDVLCGYLRTAAPAAPDDRLVEADVRRTGFDVIRTHLDARDDYPAWAGLRFSVAGAPIWFHVNLSGIVCENGTTLAFDGCALTEDVSVDFSGVRVGRGSGVSFAGARLGARSLIKMSGVRIDGGQISFARAHFAQMSGLSAADAVIREHGVLELTRVTTENGVGIVLNDLIIEGQGMLRARALSLAGGAVFASQAATIRDGGGAWFDSFIVSGDARLIMTRLTLDGGTAWFGEATFEKDSLALFDRVTVVTPSALRFTGAFIDAAAVVRFSRAVLVEGSVEAPNGRASDTSEALLPDDIRMTADGFRSATEE